MVAIDFKNPLIEKCEFLVTFDNPNFSLASKLPGPIDPGKVTSMQIKFEDKPENAKTGRMMVSTKGLPPWVYYLQGVEGEAGGGKAGCRSGSCCGRLRCKDGCREGSCCQG